MSLTPLVRKTRSNQFDAGPYGSDTVLNDMQRVIGETCAWAARHVSHSKTNVADPFFIDLINVLLGPVGY